jgi:hypothetical protein
MDGLVTDVSGDQTSEGTPWAGSLPPPWRAQRLTPDADVRARAVDWLNSHALAQLLADLGGPKLQDAEQDIEAVATWAASRLDTRSGQERHEAPTFSFMRAQIEALLRAAVPLGLVTTPAPIGDRFDVTVLLGGTVLGNHLRTELVREVESAGIRLGQLVALSTDRPLTLSERDMLGSRTNTTEWEHLSATVDEVLGPVWPTTDPGDGPDRGEGWRDARMARAAGPVRLMSAPSSMPGRRANTMDAIAFLCSQIPAARRGSVLVVTSAIYTPYQFFVVAPKLLGEGSELVEVIGTPTAPSSDPARQAQRLAQEINSTLQAIWNILRSV